MNSKAMYRAGIPFSVQVLTWLLIGAGVFFVYVFTFNPGLVFPGAQISDYSSRLGFASAGVRVLGSVIALLLSVLLNKPQWLFITLISRVIIEMGDIVVGITTGGVWSNNFMIGVIVLVELAAIFKLSQS